MTVDNKLIKQIKIIPLLETLRLENISDKEYFSARFSNYISNSRLGKLKKEGAKAFFEGFKDDGSFNASYEFGGNLHALCLQPESFELIDSVFKPTAKAGMMADYLYNKNGDPISDDDIKIASIKCNYYKNKFTINRLLEFKQKAEPYWRDRYIYEQKHPINDKIRIYTDEKSIGLLKSCLNTLEENKDIQELLHPSGIVESPYSANEQTILLDILAEIPGYESKTFKLKAKLDNFTIDKEEDKIVVNDLKTTSRLAKDFDPTYFSYQREIASYSWLLKLCAKKFFDLNVSKVEGNFLVVSTIPEFNTLVYPMTPKLFKSGWNEYSYLLKTVIYLNIVKGYEFQ